MMVKSLMLLLLHFYHCIARFCLYRPLSSGFYGPFLGFSILSTGFKAHGFGDTPTSRKGECFIMLHYVQEIMNVAY